MSEQDASLNDFAGEGVDNRTQKESEQRLPEIDSIPDDWELVTVEKIAKQILGGGTPSKSDDDYWGGDIPWASVKDLGDIELSDPEDYITEAGVENSATNVIPGNSIIISTRMTVGEPFLNGVDMAINQDMKAILPDTERVNPLFLVYSLWDKDPYLKSLGRGTTVDGITTNDLSRTHIELPSVEEQRKIASVLYTVDQAIQKTEEIINQLDRTRAGLTQSLFLNGYRECDEVVGAHHRNRLAQHPASWETKPAKEVMEVTRGAHPRPKSDTSLWGGDIPMIKIGDRNRGDSTTINSTVDTVTEKGSRSSKLVDEGTLIVSNAGTVGAARITGMEACIHDHWLILRNYEEQLDTRYLYHFINWNQNYLESLASGSTVLDLNTDDFRLFDITFPSIDEQQEISDVLDSIHYEKTKNQAYRDKLQRLKQGLMQDLLSGEVRTPDKDIEVVDDVLQYG
jgi:type I restriction enzyme S subunit